MAEKKLIFVVDDDPFILNLVKKRLETKNFEIRTFSYGEECLDHLDLRPVLVILDFLFSKPGEKVMNGMDIFEKIKQHDRDVPVIMLSGQDSGNIVLELARMGIRDYVIKDNELMNNLENAIRDIFEME